MLSVPSRPANWSEAATRHSSYQEIMVRFLQSMLTNDSSLYVGENATSWTRDPYYNLTHDEWEYIRTIVHAPGGAGPAGEVAPDYCDNFLRDLVDEYRRSYHGYICLVICVFGTVANIANIAVLTRKDMVGAPINRILTGLAVADMLVMLEYIPFSYYHGILFQNRKDFTYGGAVFILFHMNFSNVMHTISICLTIALAIWRYIAIRYPHMNAVLCSDNRCRHAIVACYTVPVLLCVPYYFTFTITSQAIREDDAIVLLYVVDLSELARHDKDRLYQASFWLYSVLFKLVPCVVLTVISVYLVKALYNAKMRKQVLRCGYDAAATSAASVGGVQRKRAPGKAERRADRTTRMLVAVLLLFLITELPQAIMGLLSVIIGQAFFIHCYNKFGETMDVLALFNGAVNFLLYCFMSRQFRTTFGNMFKPRISWHNLTSTQTAQTSVQNTFV